MLSAAETAIPRRPLAQTLVDLGLDDDERAFETDGWSGAAFSTIGHSPHRVVLKRTSPARDWIVRSTLDDMIREAWIADRASTISAAAGIRVPYLATAADGDDTVLAMPDLSAELIAWDRPGASSEVEAVTLARVLDALARMHSSGWADGLDAPWCQLPERLLLLSRPSAERYAAEGNAVGVRFVEGWDAFERLAPGTANDLVERLATDIRPLADALSALPPVGLHGDMKLANVALVPRDEVALIDWQMTLRAPVAVELGWLLVSNVAALPIAPADLVEDYLGRLPATVIGDRELQADLTWIVGLLLRGWRKGIDARDGITTGFGASAVDDLALWSRRAVDAADRRL